MPTPHGAKISLIAAIGSRGELGKENRLLWHIPKDLQRFRRLTMGHVVIMGRRTFESIGRPLGGRPNIVLSHNPKFMAPGCLVAHSLLDAFRLADTLEQEEVFVIGGGQVFAQAIPLADKLYLTLVEGQYDADTFFPDYSEFTRVIFREEQRGPSIQFTYLDLERG